MSLITINTDALKIGATVLNSVNDKINSYINTALTANAKEIEKTAKDLAPADRGFLKQHISSDTKEYLRKVITVDAPYAAYIEFGTGIYAAQSLYYFPPTWQAFALQFQGKSSRPGGFYEFVLAILDWIKRKGIVSKSAEYRVSSKIGKDGKLRTRKTRLGSKSVKFEQDYKLASAIVFSILKHGIHGHQYLYPAYHRQEKQIFDDVQAAIVKAIQNTRGNI